MAKAPRGGRKKLAVKSTVELEPTTSNSHSKESSSQKAVAKSSINDSSCKASATQVSPEAPLPRGTKGSSISPSKTISPRSVSPPTKTALGVLPEKKNSKSRRRKQDHAEPKSGSNASTRGDKTNSSCTPEPNLVNKVALVHPCPPMTRDVPLKCDIVPSSEKEPKKTASQDKNQTKTQQPRSKPSAGRTQHNDAPLAKPENPVVKTTPSKATPNNGNLGKAIQKENPGHCPKPIAVSTAPASGPKLSNAPLRDTVQPKVSPSQVTSIVRYAEGAKAQPDSAKDGSKRKTPLKPRDTSKAVSRDPVPSADHPQREGQASDKVKLPQARDVEPVVTQKTPLNPRDSSNTVTPNAVAHDPAPSVDHPEREDQVSYKVKLPQRHAVESAMTQKTPLNPRDSSNTVTPNAVTHGPVPSVDQPQREDQASDKVKLPQAHNVESVTNFQDNSYAPSAWDTEPDFSGWSVGSQTSDGSASPSRAKISTANTSVVSILSIDNRVNTARPFRKSQEPCLRFSKGYPCFKQPCQYSHELPQNLTSKSGNNNQSSSSVLPPRFRSIVNQSNMAPVQSTSVDMQNGRLGLGPRNTDSNYVNSSGQANQYRDHMERVNPTSMAPGNQISLPNPNRITPMGPLTVTVLDSTKVKLGPGFEVQDVTTGFESRWVILGYIPSRVGEAEISKLLSRYGQVVSIKMHEGKSKSPAIKTAPDIMTVKAQYTEPAEAIKAVAALNGVQCFSTTITAQLPINNSGKGAGVLRDASVRLSWEAPRKVGYGGYSTLAEAEIAVWAADGANVDGSIVSAQIFNGIPAIGCYTVRFEGLPPNADRETLRRFSEPEEVLLERPNYTSLTRATDYVQELLERCGEVLSFELLPGPYKEQVTAWAHFFSPQDAQFACDALHCSRPHFIGKAKLFVRHIQTVSYVLPGQVYDKLASDVRQLQVSISQRSQLAFISVSDRRSKTANPTLPVSIVVSGEDHKELGQYKLQFERILHGETVLEDGKPAWDNYFANEAGRVFLRDLESRHLGIEIQNDSRRRMLKLFGHIRTRAVVQRAILEKLTAIRAQQVHVIPISEKIVAVLMSPEIMDLQRSLGHDNVFMSLPTRTLIVRGNNEAFEAVQQAVRRVREHIPDARRHDATDCPVCFNEAMSPITLPCGHSWCKSCLSSYLIAATENKTFPLICLGDEAKCSEALPLAACQEVLSGTEFEKVALAALMSYVHARPDEFFYCPTADCPQIYRAAPKDSVLQCPSCLIRICGKCHIEDHDGMTCEDRDGAGDKAFKDWSNSHDVKPCPSCKTLIERSDGCNHMTCTRCRTHICWVCLSTFPKGVGIYDHMRTSHGGIGL